MKPIYIVLIRAHTGLACVARKITGYQYTHVAVSLDKSLTDFISYSRRRHYLPADAGFTHEKRDFYAFGEHRSFGAKVFCLPVSDENYDKILSYIAECESDPEQRFNLFSMATMPLLHGVEIFKSENCMSFTARIIELSGLVKLNRPAYKYSIKDIDQLLTDHAVFEGKIRRLPSAEYREYMENASPYEYITTAGKLCGELSKRMICRRKEKHE